MGRRRAALAAIHQWARRTRRAAAVSVSRSPPGTESTSPGATPWVASASPRTTRWPDSSHASASCISSTTSPRRTGRRTAREVRAPPRPSSGPVAVLATRRFRSGRAAPDPPRRRWRRRWGDSCSRTRPTRRDMRQAEKRSSSPTAISLNPSSPTLLPSERGEGSTTLARPAAPLPVHRASGSWAEGTFWATCDASCTDSRHSSS